ncbi:unnamed protein product [Moneuplotes crassus]|uniref:Uncharacterized protein n=2 Tax=Euplotes crassus TaxID=5936 RepID=A0AAD1Y3E0_EUPCR|nr:unnamed protein product [Moneuplotes crassus]
MGVPYQSTTTKYFSKKKNILSSRKSRNSQSVHSQGSLGHYNSMKKGYQGILAGKSGSYYNPISPNIDRNSFMFNPKITGDPLTKSFLIQENNSNDKIASKVKNVIKYSQILPYNDTIEMPDSERKAKKINFNPEGSNMQEIYPGGYLNEEISDGNSQSPKFFIANKYIGVYKGKFGILTRKTEVSSKNALNQALSENRKRLNSRNNIKRNLKPRNKAQHHINNAKSINIKDVDKEEESKLLIPNAIDHLYNNMLGDSSIQQNQSNTKSNENTNLPDEPAIPQKMSRTKNSKSMNMIVYPTDRQKGIISVRNKERQQAKNPRRRVLYTPFRKRSQGSTITGNDIRVKTLISNSNINNDSESQNETENYVVNKYSLPNGLQSSKRIPVYSSAEEMFGDKYSKESLALMNFIKNRQSLAANNSSKHLKSNPSINRIQNMKRLNKKRSLKSQRARRNNDASVGVEGVGFKNSIRVITRDPTKLIRLTPKNEKYSLDKEFKVNNKDVEEKSQVSINEDMNNCKEEHLIKKRKPSSQSRKTRHKLKKENTVDSKTSRREVLQDMDRLLPSRSTILNKVTNDSTEKKQAKILRNKLHDYQMFERQRSKNSYMDTVSRSSLSSIKLTQKFCDKNSTGLKEKIPSPEFISRVPSNGQNCESTKKDKKFLKKSLKTKLAHCEILPAEQALHLTKAKRMSKYKVSMLNDHNKGLIYDQEKDDKNPQDNEDREPSPINSDIAKNDGIIRTGSRNLQNQKEDTSSSKPELILE